jgi:hypothetical protein
MESRESHIRFMQQNIQLASAFAYGEYQQLGKGCIMVNCNAVKLGENWLDSFTPVFYLGEKSDLFKQKFKQQWGDSDLERMVKEYNPKTDLIFAFIRSDGGLSCYRLQIPFSPLENYQQFKVKLESGEFDWCF